MAACLNDYRFPTQYVEIVEQFLMNKGLEQKRVAEMIGRAVEPIQIERGAIDGDTLLKLFEVCDKFSDLDKPLSAQLLSQFPVTAHGMLGIVILTSPTLNHALEAAIRFYPLVMPAYSIKREEVKDQVHLLFEPEVDFGRLTHQMTETVMGAFNSIQSYVTPNHIMLEMHFRHTSDYIPTAYAGFSDPERIHFGQRTNKLILPKSNLNFPIVTANKVTMQQFANELEVQIRRFSAQVLFSQRLMQTMGDRLKSGFKLTVENASDWMNVSQRTLSRRLAEENLTFNQLALKAKIQLACFLLLSTDKTVGQIAYAAGFSNESSFSRAFKKVKGVTPLEYRQTG